MRRRIDLEPFGANLAVAWLLLFPLADFLLAWHWIPAPVSADAVPGSSTMGGLTVASFWGGIWLLALAAARRFAVRDRLSRILRPVGLAMLFAFHAYFLMLWAYLATARQRPNPDAAVFLFDNAARVPHHLLQTAPGLTVSFVLLALAASAISYRALGSGIAAGNDLGRSALAGCLLLVFSIVAAPIDASNAVSLQRILGTSEERLDARARRDVLALPEKASMPQTLPVRRFPVVVILVESLRADLLESHREAIPFLAGLFAGGIGFERPYATASHSNFSDLAFWYGQYPLKGSGLEGFPVDAAWRGTSMFKVFRDAGYPTAYISSQNELWGNMINWLRVPEVDYLFHSENHRGGTWENRDDVSGLVNLIQRGIATAGKVEDSETLSEALRWIDSAPRRNGFFLGMNLQNTHFSYVMPPDAIEAYQPSDLGFRAVYYSWPEDQKDRVRNRYLNAVRNLDRLLERFAGELKRRGLWEECLFVVLGDNGEAFYEHGFGNHSGPMYDEVVRTLALVKPPRSSGLHPTLITRPVSHIDVAAAVPALAGLQVPPSFQGTPAHLASSEIAPVFMYTNAFVRQYGIVEWPYKLLVTEFPESRTEMYRLDLDPQEAGNVAEAERDRARYMASRLATWRARQRAYYATGAYADRSAPRYSESDERRLTSAIERGGLSGSR